MWKQSTLALLCLATLCMVSDGSNGIKQLIIKHESCGPAFKMWLEPEPLKFVSGLVANGTLVFKAAHSMMMGIVEVYLDAWPHHVKYVYCEDGTSTVDPKGCYISKGETRTISGQVSVDESFSSVFTKPIIRGNVTIHNEYGELMMCGRFNITVIDN